MNKEKLIDKILNLQRKGGWTRKQLREFTIKNLKIIYKEDEEDYEIQRAIQSIKKAEKQGMSKSMDARSSRFHASREEMPSLRGNPFGSAYQEEGN